MHHDAWPFYPFAWLHDAARCLALVQQKRLALAGDDRLCAEGVSRLAAHLTLAPVHAEPRSETQAPGLSFLFGLLRQAGMIDFVQGELRMSDAGYHWLDMPAHAQIDALRQTWWFAPRLNTRWLPTARRRFPLDGHWRSILFETVRWIVALPTTRWTRAAEAQGYLLAQGAIRAAGEGQTLPRVRQAVTEQSQALLSFLLRCVLPRLALIEIRQGDAACTLRPTAEGIAWLQAALAQVKRLQSSGQWSQQRDAAPAATWIEPRVPSQGLVFPASKAPWLTMSADMEISVPLSAPAAATFEVAQFARLQDTVAQRAVRPRATGPHVTGSRVTRSRVIQSRVQYAITWQTIVSAAARDHSVADILLTLHRLSQSLEGDVALPKEALSQLQGWHRKVISIQCEPGYRLQVPDATLMDALRQRAPFRRRTQAFASRQHAWVSQKESKALLAYLRRRGYVPQPLALANEQAPSLSPALRRALPLPQLLVALRTYGHLRAHLPGLAALDLEQIELEICAALTPEQLAGVKQLIESNVILLTWAGKEAASTPARTDSDDTGPHAEPLSALEETRAPDDRKLSAQDVSGPEPPAQQPDILARVRAALDAGRPVEIIYVDARAQVTQRTVRPLRLEAYRGRTCLVAYCELRRDERHFRLDRILRVQDTGQGESGPLPFPD